MKILISLILLFTITPLPAQDADEKLVKEFMTVTGAVVSLDKLGNDLTKEIIRFYPQAEEEDISMISREISVIFNPDTLYNLYLKHFLNVYDEEKVEAILDKYKDPLFIKVTDMESRDIPDEQINSFVMNFDQTQYSEERLELINRLKEAARLSDFTHYAVKASIKIAVTASIALMGQTDLESSDEVVDLMMQQSMQELDTYITMMTLLCYKDLDDEELEEYISYYETPLGKWHTEATITSHLNTLTESAEKFSESFTVRIKSRKS